MASKKRVVADATFTSARASAFVSKAFEIFSDPSHRDACGWGSGGDTVVVNRITEFEEIVVPKYFKHSNYSSFVRQLNMYGFRKTNPSSPHNAEFDHPFFTRGRPDLLHLVKRKVKGRAKKKGASADEQEAWRYSKGSKEALEKRSSGGVGGDEEGWGGNEDEDEEDDDDAPSRTRAGGAGEAAGGGGGDEGAGAGRTRGGTFGGAQHTAAPLFSTPAGSAPMSLAPVGHGVTHGIAHGGALDPNMAQHIIMMAQTLARNGGGGGGAQQWQAQQWQAAQWQAFAMAQAAKWQAAATTGQASPMLRPYPALYEPMQRQHLPKHQAASASSVAAAAAASAPVYPAPLSAFLPAPLRRDRVLVLGAAGAIGKQLVATLVAQLGPGRVVAALRRTALPGSLARDPATGAEAVICEHGVDLRDAATLHAVLAKHAPRLFAVWNLAAPLSVETEADPSAAEDVTVGGMGRLIWAMDACGLPQSTKLLFSDSIGSFGGSAPRDNAPASWLVANPEQDPGSEYGRQKRRCRALLAASKYDTRWAVIPGVLHDDATWGAGTTEYALDALKHFHAYQAKGAAAKGAAAAGASGDGGRVFCCPVREWSSLPMIHASDLVQGLAALMNADEASLKEPERGYCLAGFSFAPAELVARLQARLQARQSGEMVHSAGGGRSSEPSVLWSASFESADGATAGRFAELWPNSISGFEAERDFGWKATVGIEAALESALAAHAARDKAD